MKIQPSQKYSKILLVFVIGIILLATSPIKPTAQSGTPCYVAPDEKVVKWMTMYTEPCDISIFSICFWPIRHPHTTYKVTLNSGIPIRDEKGDVIAATNGEERADWLTYDSAKWNMIQYVPFIRAEYSNYEPVNDNEYVVMVETRYRLFNNVDTTLGICVQRP